MAFPFPTLKHSRGQALSVLLGMLVARECRNPWTVGQQKQWTSDGCQHASCQRHGFVFVGVRFFWGGLVRETREQTQFLEVPPKNDRPTPKL